MGQDWIIGRLGTICNITINGYSPKSDHYFSAIGLTLTLDCKCARVVLS